MTDSPSNMPGERRVLQRDWLGHGLQFAGILIILGLPLLYWGSGVNTTLATTIEQAKRNSQDIIDQSRVQIIIGNQIIETGKTLVRIEERMDNLLKQGSQRDQRK